MELLHIHKDTWAAVGATALIPFYRLSDTDIILLDSGIAASEYSPGFMSFNKMIIGIMGCSRHSVYVSIGIKTRHPVGPGLFCKINSSVCTFS